jgi:hypothetical protein
MWQPILRPTILRVGAAWAFVNHERRPHQIQQEIHHLQAAKVDAQADPDNQNTTTQQKQEDHVSLNASEIIAISWRFV